MAISAKPGPIIDDDRLSNLPDELLLHILCFLDARTAVQISVLGKRWRNLWTSLPLLNFERECFGRFDKPERQRENVLGKVASFSNCVLQFLKHRAARDVFQLRIDCPRDHAAAGEFSVGYPDDGFLAEAVIDYVSHSSIRHLSIRVFDEVKNLASLFFCSYLTTLKLIGLKIRNPKFDSATITNLNLVDCLFFAGGHTLDPFEGCVNLRSLNLMYCCFLFDTRTKKFEISAPKLKDLTMNLMPFGIYCPDVELVFSTPMLTSFHYKASSVIEISRNVDLPFLEELYIDPFPDFFHLNSQTACQLIKLFEVMGNAKFVTIGSSVVEYIMKIPGILDHRPSPFTRLESLQSTPSSRPLDPNFMAYAGSPLFEAFDGMICRCL